MAADTMDNILAAIKAVIEEESAPLARSQAPVGEARRSEAAETHKPDAPMRKAISRSANTVQMDQEELALWLGLQQDAVGRIVSAQTPSESGDRVAAQEDRGSIFFAAPHGSRDEGNMPSDAAKVEVEELHASLDAAHARNAELSDLLVQAQSVIENRQGSPDDRHVARCEFEEVRRRNDELTSQLLSTSRVVSAACLRISELQREFSSLAGRQAAEDKDSETLEAIVDLVERLKASNRQR